MITARAPRPQSAQGGRAKSLRMSSNTLTVYVIGVLIAWAVVIAVGYFLKGSTAGHRFLLVCGGFLLGTLAMYIATRVHPR